MMNNSRFVSLLLFVLLVLALGGLSGCASPAGKSEMISDRIQDIHGHKHTVNIGTQGGSETGAMDAPNISNNALAAAIEESIIKNGLFTKVVHSDDSDYFLNVTIVNMSKPMFGASMTVNMEAAWSLRINKSQQVVMRETIESSYTAGAFSAFAGVTRVRIAVEGAARENIHQGLMAISKLQLD